MGKIKKYTSRPKVIEACQWRKMGDYPVEGVVSDIDYDKITLGEGPCKHCEKPWEVHGGMDTHEGYHVVCPSDYVCTGIAGELYPCKPKIFEASYDEIEEHDPNTPMDIMRKNLILGTVI